MNNLKKNHNIEIRKINKKDYFDLSRFLSDNFFPIFSSDQYLLKFEFWWDQNPSFKNNDIRGWLINQSSYNQDIKGVLLNIPIDYLYNKSLIETTSPSFWCVKKEYRKYSMLL